MHTVRCDTCVFSCELLRNLLTYSPLPGLPSFVCKLPPPPLSPAPSPPLPHHCHQHHLHHYHITVTSTISTTSTSPSPPLSQPCHLLTLVLCTHAKVRPEDQWTSSPLSATWHRDTETPISCSLKNMRLVHKCLHAAVWLL